MTWPAAVGNIDCPITGPQLEIFQKLRESPELYRFSYVDAHLLRGGQPSIAQLADLKALGVTTIISLRKERSGITAAERAEAHRLGLKFLHFPFYGIFGASRTFLEQHPRGDVGIPPTAWFTCTVIEDAIAPRCWSHSISSSITHGTQSSPGGRRSSSMAMSPPSGIDA